jgi:hypothetical protein
VPRIHLEKVVMSDGWSARCINCNAVLGEEFRQPEIPCSHSGSTARAFSVELSDTVEALDMLRMRGYRAGKESIRMSGVSGVSRPDGR